MVGLGFFAGNSSDTQAWRASADGAFVVGGGSSAAGNEAFRWSAAGGIVGLGHLSGVGSNSDSSDVSADGSVVVGTSYGTVAGEYRRQAFRWTAGAGMVGLGVVADGGIATGVKLHP